MFDDPKAIKEDLNHIKEVLWKYSTNNEYAFAKEISAIQDENELYTIRRALNRYKELRNLATLYGHDELTEHFDIGLFGKLLNEVNLRIDRINQQKALALGRLSTGSLNILLDNMEFSFKNEGTQELTVVDKLKRAIRAAGGSFTNNVDPKDPEYVNLMEKLREKLVHANMQEITTGEMTDLIGEIEELKRQADELNRKNALLTGRYGGDEKYMRIHKEMMSDAKPVTSSERQLFEILSAAKRAIDAMVSSNAAALDQPSVFKRALGPKVIQAFRNDDITLTGQQVSTTVTRLYNEYSDERKNHLR